MAAAFEPFSWVYTVISDAIFGKKRTLADDEREWERLTNEELREQLETKLDVRARAGWGRPWGHQCRAVWHGCYPHGMGRAEGAPAALAGARPAE